MSVSVRMCLCDEQWGQRKMYWVLRREVTYSARLKWVVCPSERPYCPGAGISWILGAEWAWEGWAGENIRGPFAPCLPWLARSFTAWASPHGNCRTSEACGLRKLEKGQTAPPSCSYTPGFSERLKLRMKNFLSIELKHPVVREGEMLHAVLVAFCMDPTFLKGSLLL